jgi:hypothetical protein
MCQCSPSRCAGSTTTNFSGIDRLAAAGNVRHVDMAVEVDEWHRRRRELRGAASRRRSRRERGSAGEAVRGDGTERPPRCEDYQCHESGKHIRGIVRSSWRQSGDDTSWPVRQVTGRRCQPGGFGWRSLLASSGAQSVVEKWGNMDEDSGLEGVRGGGCRSRRQERWIRGLRC